MFTTTTYGTWLPGDMRGYVGDRLILPPNPALLSHARGMLASEPVYLTSLEQEMAFEALRASAIEFGYRLTDASVESWHAHWIVEHGFDAVEAVAGRLKTRMRQVLARGRVWTEGYCHRCLHSVAEIETARQYIARHGGCRMSGGRIRGGGCPPA